MLKNQEGKLGAGNTGASSVSQLARRLLWNQILAGKSRPLPVVVLLGPAGAGKTWALNAISQIARVRFIGGSRPSIRFRDARK